MMMNRVGGIGDTEVETVTDCRPFHPGDLDGFSRQNPSAARLSWPGMFGFGQKRTRVSPRATIRPRQKLWGRLIDALQEGESLERAGLCLGAVLLLLVLLESWKAPFPYRIGDKVPHGLAAKIDFERVDVRGTELERIKAEEKVPF